MHGIENVKFIWFDCVTTVKP